VNLLNIILGNNLLLVVLNMTFCQRHKLVIIVNGASSLLRSCY